MDDDLGHDLDDFALDNVLDPADFVIYNAFFKLGREEERSFPK